jgi:lipid II:glycine glycyltransferase (peptidoglycan interpeptide bridge formation enzyme)
MGDNLHIRLARKKGVAIAAMLTLRHRNSVIYKYGCSDENFHNLGAMPFLFWKLIQESKDSGVGEIDFGRSDLNQESLITFKDRFGTTKRSFNYYRFPTTRKTKSSEWGLRTIRHFYSLLPGSVYSTAGRLVYRHIG